MKLLRINLLLLALACLLPAAAADELVLSNGDRIKGEFIKEEDGKFFFRSAILGELAVATDRASVVRKIQEIPPEALVGLPPIQEVEPPEPEPEEKPPPPERPTDADRRLPAPRPAPAPRAAPPPPPWKGKIEAGYNLQAGRRERTDLSFRFEFERRIRPNTLRFEGRYLYSTNNGRTNTDNMLTSFRLRREISELTFLQSLSSYSSDRIKRIDHNIEQQAGIGYRFLQTERQTVTAGVGAAVQYRQSEGIENGFAYMGEFFQDYRFRINGRMTLTQDLNVSYSPDERAVLLIRPGTTTPTPTDMRNYKFRFNSRMQGRITDSLSLNLRYEYEFDNTIADRSAKMDQRVTTSLGYAF